MTSLDRASARRESPPAPSGGRRLSPSLGRWFRHDARFDVPASLVVFLVAVPLSLGIAVASDAPIAAGLIAAAVGGIVAGVFGGAPLQVSGPAAGLTVVVAEMVAQFGWPATCAITVGAGVVQIVLGATRLGRFALAISPTVVSAMLAGIGISIVLGQVNVALGHSSQSSAWTNLGQLVTSVGALNLQALACAAIVVALLIIWPKLPTAVKRVPGPLVAVSGVTLLAMAVLPGAPRVDLGGSILDQVGILAMPEGTPLDIGAAVLTMALIASVESLLSAVAVDKLQDGPRARLNKELVGQGLANSTSGLLGGLPVTGVIVRSSTNVAVGARTRASAILHGVWVLVFVLVLVGVVEQIPLAALAGILLVMGTALVKITDLKQARTRGELWIYAVTVLAVLALNLIEGVMIGLACALVLILVRMARVSADVHPGGTLPDGRELWVVDVRGSLSFLATPMLMRKLSALPDAAVVEVDLLLDYQDPAGREQIETWARRYEADGGSVTLDFSGPAAHGTVHRGAKSEPVTPRTGLPWSRWQNGSRSLGTEEGPDHHPLALGVREYHRRTIEALRPVYAEVRDGQHPDAAFLTCVDSRVVPNLLTSSGPGDLFTIRTMGNLVPVGELEDGSVSAPLLYATDQLDVHTVVVCGHSGCGAMAGALAGGHASIDGPISRWMRHAEPALNALADHPAAASAADRGLGPVDQLAQVNVAVGVDQIRSLLADRAVRVVGLFVSFEDGVLSVLRDDTFVPLTDAELEELDFLREPAPVTTSGSG